MIIPDTNLLVYAYNSETPQHSDARRWWEDINDGTEIVGLPWVVSIGFIRLMTNPRIVSSPLSLSDAVGLVREWLDYEHIIPLNPGPGHITLLHQILQSAGRGGNLVTDAHIAAFAIEHQAEIHTYNVSDFSRFPGVRFSNPLRVSD